MKNTGFKDCPVSLCLIAVNILIFAAGALTRGSEAMYMRGALYAPLLLKGRDFYRLLTAVFLHADAAHLFNNMIVLFAGGTILERRVGHVRFAILYLLSGLAGNLVSVAADWLSGSYGFSVGASGAVFGVIGAMIFLIARGGWRAMRAGGGRPSPEARRTETRRTEARRTSAGYRSLLVRTALMTGYLLYSGWSNPSINQAAHVGGLVCGALVCAVLVRADEDVELEELLR